MKCGANFWRADKNDQCGVNAQASQRHAVAKYAQRTRLHSGREEADVPIHCAPRDVGADRHGVATCVSDLRHACLTGDFLYARPWRENNVPILDSSEMVQRQQEWNSYVDEYVTCRDSPTPVCKFCRESKGTVQKSRGQEGPSTTYAGTQRAVRWRTSRRLSSCAASASRQVLFEGVSLGRLEALPQTRLRNKCRGAPAPKSGCLSARRERREREGHRE